MVENLGLVGEESFAAIGANGKRGDMSSPRVGLRMIATRLTRQSKALWPVGFEEPAGEPVGDLKLLGELPRQPFASRRTRVEVLRVQALPGGGQASHHVREHALVVGAIVGRVYGAAGQIVDVEPLGSRTREGRRSSTWLGDSGGGPEAGLRPSLSSF
jgi:hypothetical protein